MTSIETKYKDIFNTSPTYKIFSPGRVNLIGEHTDYSGGLVFPMALSLGIHGVYAPRSDKLIEVYSEAFEDRGVLTINLDDLAYKKHFSYGNYIQGTLAILQKHGYTLTTGFNLYLSSTLPASSGLSSSAALEMLVIGIYESLTETSLDPKTAVKYAKEVENEYFNLSSGIMDQFAVKFGKKGHAMLLNTKTLEVDYTPFDLTHYTLFLMNTNKTRNLEESNYNERFQSVYKGEQFVKKKLHVDALGDVDLATFKALNKTALDDTVLKRITHVVSENDRVKNAYHALENGDVETFGNYLYASHESLRDDFEVSCAELDFLTEENKKLGAIGARMTGAGFGGTMIALYPNKNVPTDFDRLRKAYTDKFKKPLDIYQAESSNGVNWEAL
ncbi:MAG: galactokinase [Bacillota bacterium]